MNSQNPEEYPETPESGEAYEGVAPEYEAYPAEATQYDPGAAFVDENQIYAAPEAAYYDPNQAYEDPAAIYEDPNQAYAGYPEGYVDPAAGYVESNAGYAEYETYAAPTDGGVYDEAPAPPPVAPRQSAAPKKKVTKRAPQRKPVAGKNAPPAKRPGPKPVVYKEGISMMTVFLTVIALGMLAAVAMVMLPRDMSTVGGYPINPLAGEKPRNLLAEAQKIMIDRNTELSLSEEEVNRYLNQRLQGEQKGPMAALVKFRGVYLDFAPGTADVVIERELFGMPITMSAKLTAEQTRGRAYYKPAGWTLGRVELGERNVKPVIDLFIRLRGTCLDEYQAIQQMSDVRFEDNRVVLDARI
jgi:hypothetical protein